MGARAQCGVQMHNGEYVYLYTHWGQYTLEDAVKEALKKGEDRWDDPEYLARIVFQQMLDGDTGTTGYGIGNEVHGDVDLVIELTNQQLVIIGPKSWTFREFVSEKTVEDGSTNR